MDFAPSKINPEYLLPGTMVGPWQIVDLLGKGGFGVAYKVRRDGRYYALKLTLFRAAALSPEQRERHEARVRRECGILLQLNHPNIVRVHGFEQWPDLNEGYLYIVMDLVNGQSLYAWREQSVPSLRRICHVFQRIALALAEAHARGAFHRDLKSENILVGADGEPMVIDWGIARSRGAATVTQDHSVIGTHSHLPPEYCHYIDFDAGAEEFTWTPQSELHALGYMLYEMLTGRSPFNLPDEESTSNEKRIIERLRRTTIAIKSITPEVPSLINAKVPAALDVIAMRLLEKNAADRYASGTELAKAFGDALADADAAWEAPFDVPPPPQQAKPHAQGQPEKKSPEMLPALGSAPPLVPPDQAEAKQSSHFRAPTEVIRPFVVPEEPGEARAKPRAPSEEVVQAAREQLLQRVRRPARLPPRKTAAAIGAAAALLVAIAFLRARAPAPTGPESLLRKVERAEKANITAAATKQQDEDVASSGVPPLPALPGNKLSVPTARAAETKMKPPPPPPADGHATAMPKHTQLVAAVRAPKVATPEPHTSAHEDDSSLEFGERVGAESAAAAKGPARYHVQTGARIRASLDLNLDSRTVSGGPAAVRLRRAYISDGRVVFPAGTMAYGDARTSGARFTVRFTRLVLPNKTEVVFEGLAYDIQDRKPGLAPSRRVAGAQQQDGTGTKVGRAVAGTVLSVVNGGLVQDAARTAGEIAVNSRDPGEGTMSGDALLLDAGAEMDVLVTKPF
jgi:serine/threonine protein kinase